MQRIHLETLVVGSMQENCYLLADPVSKEAVIIDPGDDAVYITDHVTAYGALPVAILATHGHFDHVMAVGELQKMYDIPFYIGSADTFLLNRLRETAEHFLGHPVIVLPPVVNHPVSDGDTIAFGMYTLHAHAVAGHTPGSMMYVMEDERMAFVGDVIFEGGSVGRTDFSYSDAQALRLSIGSVLQLPGNTVLYPGHGNPTTVDAAGVYFM